MKYSPARALAVGLLVAAQAVAGPFDLKPEDHVAVVGNALADGR